MRAEILQKTSNEAEASMTLDVPPVRLSTIEETTSYWRAELQDFEPTPFPCVSAFKPETQIQDSQVTEFVGSSTLQNVTKFSKATVVSPSSVLQAAWATILFSYTGSTTDISFGSVLSHGLDEELKSCAATPFTVVPSKLGQIHTTGKTIGQVLSLITSKNLEALPHRHIPLGSISNSEGKLPYDTLLAFQVFDQPSDSASLREQVEYPGIGHEIAVKIEASPTESDAIRFRATYTSNHLDQLAAETMLRQLDAVVVFLCEHPHRSFLDAQFALDAHLLSSIPVKSSPNHQADGSDLLLHRAFQRHVSLHPDSPALFFSQSMDGSVPDVQWTYGDLHTLARNLAARLVKQFGPVANEAVMICMEKCPELYVTILGVLYAGAGWCPIDPYSPPTRQRSIMERAGSRILLISPTATQLDSSAIPDDIETFTVDVQGLVNDVDQIQPNEVTMNADPSHLAYLIFTSGTTGLPKAVPITHKSAAIAMNALAEAIPSDVKGGVVRCMAFSEYTFDVSVQDLFYTWTLGGTVISSTRGIMIQDFAELANRVGATHAHLTPAFSATAARSRLKTMEVVTMIGEKLTEAVAKDWGAEMRAYNTYGPAEVTVVSTLRQFTGEHDTHPASNVGVPLPSVGTYVMNSNRVVMRGGIGELALSGPQLSSGYRALPDVNAKKFVWNEQLQKTLYLTGDLVRHLADGTINFVGRNDDLVKIGGIRMELSEIAFALRDADSRIDKFEVLHCKRKGGDDKLLIAFLASQSLGDGSVDIKALTSSTARDLAEVAKNYARDVLPPPMMPAIFVPLPQIPRTASAKVDRAKLTAIYHSMDLVDWDSTETSTDNDQDAEWREKNKTILQVIANTLRISPASFKPSSGLPAIGIDSIGAIRLVPKINALGYDLFVVDAFKCRTLADLCELAATTAAEVKGSNEQNPDQLLESFDARYYNAVSKYLDQDDIAVVPTTVLQESLLGESFKEPLAYWSSHLFQLSTDVDIPRLKRAWVKTARQTEALRVGFVAKAMLQSAQTPFNEDSLSYLQVIYDEPQVDWCEISTGTAFQQTAKMRVNEIAATAQERLFHSPPWAVDVLNHNDGSSIMMFTIHHSIYDASSLNFLQADVMANYHRGGKVPSRLPLRQAIAHKSAIDAENEQCVQFWKYTLRDFELTPAGEQTMAQTGTSLQHRIHRLRSRVPFTEMRAAARELGLTSVVTILRVAWAIVLTDILETAHVLFAEILSDRMMDSKLESVVGPMLSTVPSVFQRQDTVAATLAAQDAFSKMAWENRNVRPGTIKNILKRGPSSQVYPAVFAFNVRGDDNERNSSTLWEELENFIELQVEHPFALNVWQDNEATPYFQLAVAEQLMSPEEQQLLLLQIDALVGSIVEHPKAELASLTDSLPTALISKTTPRQDTACPSPHSPTYWVELHAATHPEWKGVEVALKIDYDGTSTESWTYAELNAEANRVAHWIVRQGVSKRMIGMCLRRTLTSYAVILAIMKSGNAYLPIDESLPAERKAFLLKDSNSAFVFATNDLFDDVELPSICHRIDVDADIFKDAVANSSPENVSTACEARDNCYLLYTSGSTGKPKGVLVNRENLSGFVEAFAELIYDASTTADTAGRGKWLGLASRAFDVHIGEAFLAWRFGLTAVTAPRSVLLDDLALALSSLHITHACFVPSLLDQTGLTPEDTPDLVYLSVGGEKMSPKTKKLWGDHHRVALINAYGPTEATIGCCAGRLFPGSDTRDIGSPLGDSQAHILIPGTDNYALRNMPGELCFTGSLIANGYLNRSDAKGFVENFNGQRMYRTGDIVKLGMDDHVYFLGRKDDQVKIRGQRVELGEVAEGVRTASDNEIDVAALVVKHSELSRMQLVAFIAPLKSSKNRSEQQPEVDRGDLQNVNTGLRSKCQQSLPSAIVPDLIVPVTYIPLTATSAKADMKLLTKIFSSVPIREFMPNSDGGAASAASKRDMTAAEQKVWGIVSSVLKQPCPTVTPGSTVFELGIDSLSGIAVFSKLRAQGYDCSVSMIMKNPTIESLARSSKKCTEDHTEVQNEANGRLAEVERQYLDSAAHTNNILAVRPCLPLQEVLVAQSLHEESNGTAGAYVNHIRFQVDEDLNAEQMRSAWEKLAEENEILRTCFSTSEDDFLQIVLRPGASRLVWRQHSIQSQDDIANYQKDVGSDLVANLTTHPPVRLTHLTGRERNILLLSIHHALYDGNSLTMMLSDVQRNYDSNDAPRRPSMVPLIEYIVMQDREALKSYWTTLLQNWEAAPLMNNVPSKNVTLNTAERRFGNTLSQLESEVSSAKFTLATLLQCVFAVAMAQTIQTSDFIFGNVLSGRATSVENANDIMAPCITTVPQRLKIDNVSASVSDILIALQASNSMSLDHQHVSPRDIQKWTKADRPLYDCLFSFVRREESVQRSLKHEGSDIGVDYPLAVEFEADPTADELHIRAGFTDSFGSASDAALLLEKIEILTETFLRQGDLAVSTLGIPTAGNHAKSNGIEQYDETNWEPLERQVRALVSQHTSIPEADIRKDTAFIHLGIDSIGAIRFAKQLRNQGIRVSSADIVRYNRVGSLCSFLTTLSDIKIDFDDSRDVTTTQEELRVALSSQSNLEFGTGVDLYECTPLQSGMLAQSLATDGALYMHHHATHLITNVDLQRLKSAWEYVVADLDVLRTTFHWLPNSTTPWVAAVHADKVPNWTEIDVQDAHQHWLRLSKELDLLKRIQNAEPLASVQILKTGNDAVMVLSLHHAIYDGISLGMLYERFSMGYQNIQAPPTTPFFQAARVMVQNAKPAVQFWAEHVAGYVGAPDFGQSLDTSPSLFEHTVTEDMAILEEKCRASDMDVKSVCVAAFGKAMACLYGRRDVVFGHVIAARHNQASDGNDIVGPTFNTVPFRIVVRDQLMTNQDLVQQVDEVNTQSIEHHHGSLAEVQKIWKSSTADPSAQLIDSIFVYSKIESKSTSSVFGEPLETDRSPVPSEYRMNFEVEHTQDTLIARALSSAPSGTTELLLDNFSQAVHDILDQPARFATAFPKELRELPMEVTPAPALAESFDENAVGRFANPIRAAMAEVAQVAEEKIALNTSIYSFGIDSIAAIQIVSRCKQSGVRLSVTDILKGAVLGKICEIVAAKSDKPREVSKASSLVSMMDKQSATLTLHIGEDQVEDTLPCMPGQEYHLISWLQSGRTLYEPGWCYRSTESLDPGMLKASWRKLRERNTVLRTMFAAVGADRVVQLVLKPEAMAETTFETLEDSRCMVDAVKERAHIEARTPSNLYTIPVRLRLIKAKDGDAIMVYVHHALYDAWSMPRLVSELASLCAGEEIESTPSFTELVRFSHRNLNRNDEEAFWKDSLANCEKAILPSKDRPSDELDRRQSFSMSEGSKADVAELELICSTHSISPHHVVLLAFARALAQATATSSPLFGFFQVGRSAAFDEIDKVTGPCLNILPIGLRAVLEEDALSSLKSLQKMLGARLPFEQSSIRTAVKAFDPTATQLPFNANINMLWHKSSLAAGPSKDDLFQPLPIGVPIDFASPSALPGRTAVSVLDTGFLPSSQLFVDVGPGEKGLVFGVRADAALMGIQEFVERFEDQIVEIMGMLRDG